MIKAIFFDIDGTLVTKNAKALESTRKAIAAAQAQGIICGVATGRGPVHLSEQVDELNLDVFVTYNGQLVYTNEETIRAEYFETEVLDKIVDFAAAEKRQIMFGGKDKIDGSSLMRFGQNVWAKRLARFLPRKLPVKLMKKMLGFFQSKDADHEYHQLAVLKEPIYQCVLLSSPTEQEMLIERFPECQLTRSNPYVVDIIPKGGSKIEGLKACAAHFGFSLEDIMAFGDSWNDLEMLSGVGIGVAMGNGEEEVKQAANFVTKSNEEDGIYHAFKHFGLIEEENK